MTYQERMAHLKGNKGEWSEPYVFLKLLVDGRICQADIHLKANVLDSVGVIKVIREEVNAERLPDGTVRFNFEDCGLSVHDVLNVASVDGTAKKMYLAIDHAKGKLRNLQLADFLASHGFNQLKNPAIQDKRDITVKIDDPKSGGQPELGYSVKSYIGGAPTLFNASKQTNLLYRVKGVSSVDAKRINDSITGRNKIIDKCRAIEKIATFSGITFERYCSSTFAESLELIDSVLPSLLADLLKVHYFHMILQPRAKARKGAPMRDGDRVDKAVEVLQRQKYIGKRPEFCEVKVKRFLHACALGLKPSHQWNDTDDASGGYVIAKPNGELVGFYAYNRNLFEEYLFRSTIFERPSTSRHEYLKLYPANDGTGDYLIKINLQIRFMDF